MSLGVLHAVMEAGFMRPQALRWAALGAVLGGLVLFLAFYNVFGAWAARDAFYLAGWLATIAGAAMLVGATFWAFHRQEKRGIRFVVMVMFVALLSVLLVVFSVLSGFGT